jgi:hypothetical protein
MSVVVAETPNLETAAESSAPRSVSTSRADDATTQQQAAATTNPPGPEAEAELAPMYYI